MREIELRAWDNKTKEYRVVEYLHFGRSGEVSMLTTVSSDFRDPWDQLPDEVVLEQYTGLKDKNGKKIYDGDIVHQFDDEEHFVVEFKYGGFLPFTAHMLTFDVDYCEIIGNIHENPELLEGKE